MMSMPNDARLDDLVEAIKTVLTSQGRIYMHFAKATIERFGREGEMTVRLGLRAYGLWRGREMRAAHHALGKDINMATLIGCWDNASTYVIKDDMDESGTFEPSNVRFDVPYCPAAEAWQDAEFYQWGHVYCDEFHQACASAYHPDGNVVIPQNMMKGDSHCHFQWIMPPDAETLELGAPDALGRKLARDYQPSGELEDAWLALKRSNRLLGGHYFTLARPLIERHGEAGRAAVVDALERWGAERGRLLRQRHEAAGIEPGLAAFVRHHDLPLALVWESAEVEASTTRVVVEIGDTPHDDAWADADVRELGALWYETAYPAMVAAYLPGAGSQWTRLRARGDAVSRLELSNPGGPDA